MQRHSPDAWRKRNPGVDLPAAEIDALVDLERALRVMGNFWAVLRVDEADLGTVRENFGYVVSGGHVTGLGLRGEGLTSLPDSIGNLKSLTRLHLGGNKLQSLVRRGRLVVNYRKAGRHSGGVWQSCGLASKRCRLQSMHGNVPVPASSRAG